jgi:hypothetical protein
LRHDQKAAHQQGAATSAGSAPDQGACADQKALSQASQQKIAWVVANTANPSEDQPTNVTKLETTGRRVLARKPNNDSWEIRTGTRKTPEF